MKSGRFVKGQSGNPAGKPKGATDLLPRSAKAAVAGLLQRFGSDTAYLATVLSKGLDAKAPSSFPYLRLVVEQQVGAPDQNLAVTTKIVHEHHHDT